MGASVGRTPTSGASDASSEPLQDPDAELLLKDLEEELLLKDP